MNLNTAMKSSGTVRRMVFEKYRINDKHPRTGPGRYLNMFGFLSMSCTRVRVDDPFRIGSFQFNFIIVVIQELK